MRQWSQDHPDLDQVWFTESNYLICLSVPDLGALELLSLEAFLLDIPQAEFREPDLSDELTAIVLAPGEVSAKLLSRLPLALKKAEEP